MAIKQKRKEVVFKVVLLLGLPVLLLGVIEIGLRLLNYDLNLSPHWRYHAKYGWTINPSSDFIDSVNSDGFRFSAMEAEKPAKTKRLLILGDSFSQATAFPYINTYPGILDQWLDQYDHGENWEVLNLGVGDWGSAQQLLALLDYGLAYDPDVVVLQIFPFNDLCNNNIFTAGTCSMQDFHRPYMIIEHDTLKLTYVNETQTKLRNALLSFGLVENLFTIGTELLPGQHSGSLKNIRRRRNHFFKENARKLDLEYPGTIYSLLPTQYQPPRIQRGWEITEAIFQEISNALNKNKIKTISLVVPYFRTFTPEWDSYKKGFAAPLEPEYATRHFEEISQRMDFSVISLRNKILKSRMLPTDFFLEDGHFNSYGHLQVASWILEELKELGVTDIIRSKSQFTDIDLIEKTAPEVVVLSGITNITTRGETKWRTGLGPETRIAFWSPSDMEMELDFQLFNIIPGQSTIISVNGSELNQFSCGQRFGDKSKHMIRFKSSPGRNEIIFTYKDWNHKDKAYFPEDRRAVAINFIKLLIQQRVDL